MKTTLKYLEEEYTQQCEVQPFVLGDAVAFSSRSPFKDSVNEDAAAIFDLGRERGVLVVADGMGGLPGGEQASALTLEEIESALGNGSLVRENILNGIEEANTQVINSKSGGGTTVALVEINGNCVRPYHVGDSEILLVGQRGKVKLHTVSHSPTSYAFQSGLIDANEAMFHAQRHLVSNVVGFTDMRIEIGTKIEMAAKDTLLLATDGLLDNLPLGEICAAIRSGPLDKVAAHLADMCHYYMGSSVEGRPSKPDDVTFIIYRQTPSKIVKSK